MQVGRSTVLFALGLGVLTSAGMGCGNGSSGAGGGATNGTGDTTSGSSGVGGATTSTTSTGTGGVTTSSSTTSGGTGGTTTSSTSTATSSSSTGTGGSDGGAGCQGAADGTPCNDGDPCTQTDTCQAGTCTGANPVVCTAQQMCHVAGTCNPASGACSNPAAADGSACDDGNPCTVGDACSSGVCVSGPPLTCAPTDSCHTATCNSTTGACSSAPKGDGASCDDGNACTSGDVCTAGACNGTVCPVCAADLSAFFGSQTTGWNLNGSAAFSTASQTLVLTDGSTTAQAGTAIFKDAITVDSFNATFQFRVTTTNGRGDGIAFMIETSGPTALGSAYGGFGVLGLTGYAVELDVFDSGPCDPGNGNHAAIDLLSPCATNSGIPSAVANSFDLYDSSPTHGVGDIGDGGWRTATIQLVSGTVSVMITDASNNPVVVPNLQGVALPGFTSGTPYYFGIGAGTGSNSQFSKQEIKNLAIVFPAQRCL